MNFLLNFLKVRMIIKSAVFSHYISCARRYELLPSHIFLFLRLLVIN